ncbi:aminofutalosine synthase MqnE [Candidatus Sumerlaeota bacterium]|nr:aminofutalosine synthase MqnE [Candidatus Sumerlaeota bacterium]
MLDRALWPIYEKVVAGERLSLEDGRVLFETPDLIGAGQLAGIVRAAKNGDDAYFIINQHINYCNICALGCDFCAFSAKEGDAHAWVYSVEEIVERARRGVAIGAREFHVVGGLHPTLPWEYYLDMLRALKAEFPHVHLKGFTAVEIDYFARKFRKSYEEVLTELIEAGLNSMPGGGAEIFADHVHDQICKQKIRWDKWSEVHRTAHQLGVKSNATMLYGHVESAEDRLDHMLRLRGLQDETGGFMTFIPLHFHPENTPKLSHLRHATGQTDLRCIAVGRLMLDNFDHVKAYWTMLGLKLAQTALHFGADDFDGTVTEERITHFAGADTPQLLPVEQIVRLIAETGRRPVERDTTFDIVRIHDSNAGRDSVQR